MVVTNAREAIAKAQTLLEKNKQVIVLTKKRMDELKATRSKVH